MARLGAPRRTKDQWKAHVIAINSSLKSLKVGTYTPSVSTEVESKLIPAMLQFEILDTVDNPGSITLHVNFTPPLRRAGRCTDEL